MPIRRPAPYETDLPSPDPSPYQFRLLDPAPHRNVAQPSIRDELDALPDARLIATLISLGAPRWFAEQIRHSPQLRFHAVATWCLVQDAKEGLTVTHARTGEVTSARELVDGMREQYLELRKAERISEVPGRTVGLIGER